MNLSRLMVLGVLAEHGQMHGHQIRRHAEITNVQAWGGVSVGSLYRELNHMAVEGLVEPVRQERPGRRPERTIYRITDAGIAELTALRALAVVETPSGPDSTGVALLFGGFNNPVGLRELANLLATRRDAISARLTAVTGERQQLLANGHINELVAAVFRRKEAALSAELDWHEEFAATMHRLMMKDKELQ